MKRSTIAVCLLLLSPSGVMACYDDHNTGPGWFDEHTPRWSTYGSVPQTMHRDKLMEVSLFVGGLGVVILVGVAIRAKRQAARHIAISPLEPATGLFLAEPFDGPTCEGFCVQDGPDSQDRSWPSVKTCDINTEYLAGASSGINTVMSFS